MDNQDLEGNADARVRITCGAGASIVFGSYLMQCRLKLDVGNWRK